MLVCRILFVGLPNFIYVVLAPRSHPLLKVFCPGLPFPQPKLNLIIVDFNPSCGSLPWREASRKKLCSSNVALDDRGCLSFAAGIPNGDWDWVHLCNDLFLYACP